MKRSLQIALPLARDDRYPEEKDERERHTNVDGTERLPTGTRPKGVTTTLPEIYCYCFIIP